MLYMVRRHCGLGVAAFRTLRWEEQELIREGLYAEFDPERWKQAVQQVQTEDMDQGSLAALYDTDEPPPDLASSLEELSGFGINVREV